ncbi:CAS1 protein [Colletotrichum higginsianum IMI 349063]|uniref:CAS1 protein n=1 Tax=Colletotrichum higginsianum (strain IMI 349063) TaxID=759273 RepID=A0A1B7XTU7_COLHI|nr:CAS1 protein [Colletotrichum higginsianum IMI 349063]OBR03186.1 CAS1 protein [Colletotrichum higginsianum IMI 349063]
MAQGQGVIIAAQGPAGPASPGLLGKFVRKEDSFQDESTTHASSVVDQNKVDANIINKQEIVANVVNECGRTILQGNIDIGEETENQLGNRTVTQVTSGANVDVTIAQVSADGAGPYSCDLDLTSNSNGAAGQTKLTVQEFEPQNGQIRLTVTMPADMACVGASTGDVCTVRCFNDNAKGPFGGCFAVQQTDITPKQNTPDNIPTAAKLEGVLSQVQQDIVDFPAAVKSNQEAATQGEQGLTAVKELLPNANMQAAGSAAAAISAGTNPPAAEAPNTGTPNTATPNTGTPNTPPPNNPAPNTPPPNVGKAKGKGGRAKGKGKGLAGLAALFGGGGAVGGGQRQRQQQQQQQQQGNNKRTPEDLLSSRFARRDIFGRND